MGGNPIRWQQRCWFGLVLGLATAIEIGLAGSATRDSAPPVLISAIFADGWAPGDADEAIQLWNTGDGPVDLAGWSIGDGEGVASFPAGGEPETAQILADGRIWLARDAAAFARSFGHPPDWLWSAGAGGGSEGDRPGARRLVTLRGGPVLANTGDELVLRSRDGEDVDSAVYGTGAIQTAGWSGPAIQVYHPPAIAAAHQVLYRKLDPATGAPLGDSDRASDWASDTADAVHGRRVRFPGWDLEAEVRPPMARSRAWIEVAVAPDALAGFLGRHLQSAQSSVDLVVYTFEHPALAEVLAERARAGVRVRVLVEGRPAGGIEMNQRWGLARIAAAGGSVHWLDAGGDIGPRYRGLHAKVAVIDGRTVLVGSENFSLGAAPDDDPADGTLGRRGVYLATDALAVVAWARDLVARDLDPAVHVDVRPFQARDPDRGAPAPDFEPARASGGTGYTPIAPDVLRVEGDAVFEMITSPENALAPGAGLLGILARAGPGDEVLVEQLDEPVWWGAGPTEGAVALNPRLDAYLAAARRGARVRVLLDGYFDDPAHWNSNAASVAYLRGMAAAERLDLDARLGNPAGLGLHNKMVLVRASGSPAGATAGAVLVSHIGSLNGSEVASKANREAAIQVESPAIHRHLARMFAWDWAESGANAVWLPWVGSRADEMIGADDMSR
jgi:phosphatidylserine/phosphatidylglycerophosphate/cardiolipin synthase-like enzyme